MIDRSITIDLPVTWTLTPVLAERVEKLLRSELVRILDTTYDGRPSETLAELFAIALDLGLSLDGIINTAADEDELEGHATYCNKQAGDLVASIASCVKEGEPDPGGDEGEAFVMEPDDAISTLHHFIDRAREALGMVVEKPDITDDMTEDELADHNEAMDNDPQYRDAVYSERNQ